MAAKLIIIEGLPGSGKSTTAQMTYEILKDKGIEAELFCEGNYNHPADYDGTAYFNNEEFNTLQQTHPSSKYILDEIKIKYCNGYLIPYRKAIEEQYLLFNDELLNDITKNDIYELPIELHMKLIMNKWDDFVDQYIDQDKVIIFECCFIQNPVTVTMVRSNSPKEVTMNYVKSLAEKIVPLEPILIYLEQKDVKASFKRVVGERPKEWFEGFMHYYTNQGYGLDNHLKELDGVIQVLEARTKLEREIYEVIQFNKYRIDNSTYNLNLHKEKIRSILEVHL